VFLAALGLTLGLRLWLVRRHIRHIARCRAAVPADFAEHIDLAAHRKAADYSIDKARLGVIDLVLGALFLLSADKIVPHAHPVAGHHGPDVVHLRRVWLMVFAIVLHNFPEGMAIGVGFAGNDPSVGMPLTAAIAIQDVPEGLVVAIALRTVAYRPVTAALIGAASGLVEPVGAILGNVLTTGFAMLYPLGLGFAAGAMIWVVSHEIIPETHRKGHEQAATLGLIGGFVVMMMLDTALG